MMHYVLFLNKNLNPPVPHINEQSCIKTLSIINIDIGIGIGIDVGLQHLILDIQK